MIRIQQLIDDERCYETVRQMRWPDGVACPRCQFPEVTKRGRDETQSARQRYHCRHCQRDFDDLTGTIFAGHHQALGVWMLCLYIRRSTTAQANMPAMMTAMVFVKSTSTRWKVSGHCSVRGYDHIAASRRRIFHCIWASLSSFTTSGNGGKPCEDHCYNCS